MTTESNENGEITSSRVNFMLWIQYVIETNVIIIIMIIII